eukprot:SAG31_NODE_1617_length_7733_cov_6.446817_8_plen_85_part_00
MLKVVRQSQALSTLKSRPVRCQIERNVICSSPVRCQRLPENHLALGTTAILTDVTVVQADRSVKSCNVKKKKKKLPSKRGTIQS